MEKHKLLDKLAEMQAEIEKLSEIGSNPDHFIDTETGLGDMSPNPDYSEVWENIMLVIEYFSTHIAYIGDDITELMKEISQHVEIKEREPIKPSEGQLPLDL